MSDYPALENFLAAYFHQDWAMEHDTPEAVVAHYRDAEPAAQVDATRAELAQLLGEDLDEAQLAARARALGCEFDPGRDGRTWRAWLGAVQAGLAAS